MKLPGDLYMSDTKVIESKTVCYCSNFDLNVNEWFNEYENIEIFKINVNKNLGKFFFFFYFRLLIYMVSLPLVLIDLKVFNFSCIGEMWLKYFS